MSTQENKTWEKSLKHYTGIEGLFGILFSKSLFLSDPKCWTDKNDSASVGAFCRKKGKNIEARVLCFTQEEETVHHWNRYAQKGCCINFDKDILFENLNTSCFLYGKVEYKSFYSDNPKESITADSLNKLNADKLPFLKRKAYSCESEYRVIWFGPENKVEKNAIIKFDIKKAIRSIVLAPDLKKREFFKEILKKKYGIKVNLSRVEESDVWINTFNNIAKHSSK